jgi:ribosomal protein S18 acetylase RimI-like enzyme
MTVMADVRSGGTAEAHVIELRPPTSTDRERVREIVTTTGVFRPEEISIALEVFDDGIAKPEQDYWLIGAFDGAALLGFAAFGAVPCTAGTWDLYWIAVDPAAQGRGVGRKLMAYCEETIGAEGGRLIAVQTSSRDDYGPTRAFYDRLGYEAQATILEYYAPGDGLIVYTKYLDSSGNETGPYG